MDYTQQFLVGDRVRTIRPIGDLPSGASGTVQRSFSISSLCDVRFDGYRALRVIHRDNLTLETSGHETGDREEQFK